jgi:hypothetical protein
MTEKKYGKSQPPNASLEFYPYTKPVGCSHTATYATFTLQHLGRLKVPNVLNRWCSYMLSLDVSRVVLNQRKSQKVSTFWL